jgi:hypothetical protein
LQETTKAIIEGILLGLLTIDSDATCTKLMTREAFLEKLKLAEADHAPLVKKTNLGFIDDGAWQDKAKEASVTK